MNNPETIADVLRTLSSPLCTNWSWMRREGEHGASLSVYVDDITNDRRTVIEIRERPGSTPMIYRSTLHKFDPVRNMWGGYTEQRIATEAPDRRAWSALVQYVQRHAIATKGVPNPKFVHFFAPATAEVK